MTQHFNVRSFASLLLSILVDDLTLFRVRPVDEKQDIHLIGTEGSCSHNYVIIVY